MQVFTNEAEICWQKYFTVLWLY